MFKRIISFLLAAVLCFGMLPVSAFAEQADLSEEIVLIQDTEPAAEPEGTTLPPEIIEIFPTETEQTEPPAAEETTDSPVILVTEETTAPEETTEEEETEANTLSSQEDPALSVATVSDNTCGADLTWEYDYDNRILTISGTGAMTDFEEDDAPWYYKSPKEIRLPEGLTHIGSYAFSGFSYLTDINLPSTLKSIGQYAFKSCEQLMPVQLPEGLTTIGRGAFRYCWRNFTEISIPDTVTSIGIAAFYDCYRLETVRLPSSMTALPNQIFQTCVSLSEIPMPSGLRSIGSKAFMESTLSTLRLPATLTSIGANAFTDSDLTVLIFQGKAPSISADAFTNCKTTAFYPQNSSGWSSTVTKSFGGQITWVPYTDLDSIQLTGTYGDNLTWVLDSAGTLTITGTGAMAAAADAGEHWLPYKNSVRNVIFSDGITNIGAKAFEAYTNLKTVQLPSDLISIDDRAFLDSGLEEVTLPEGLHHIGWHALSGTALSYIEIPDSVQSIGDSALSDCKQLTGAKLSESMTEIPDGLFSSCDSLTSFTVPDHITSIGARAFAYSALKEIFIPDSVTYIGESAFSSSKLVTVELPDSLTVLNRRLFSYCSELVTVTLPETLETIGENVFDSSSLVEIEIPKSVKSIGNDAFTCGNLRKIILHNNPTGVMHAFSCATGIAYVDAAYKSGWASHFAKYSADEYKLVWTTFSGSPETAVLSGKSGNVTWQLDFYGNMTLSGSGSTANTAYDALPAWGRVMNQIKTLTVNHGVTRIGDYAFNSCPELTAVSLPNTLQGIGQCAFEKCSNLESITLTDLDKPVVAGEYGIDGGAFAECPKLTQVPLPDGITYIGVGAFNDCTQLQSLTIPKNVTRFSEFFEGCTSLSYLRFLGPLEYENVQEYNNIFEDLDATVYYPADGIGWTQDFQYYSQGYWWATKVVWVPEIPEGALGGKCGEDVIWTLRPDGSFFLSGSGEMFDYSPESPTPWQEYASQIKSVTVIQGPTSIGSYAFADCTSLTKVTYGDDLSSIRESAFRNCTALTQFPLYDSLHSLGAYAFAGSGLTSFSDQDRHLTDIGEGAFADCKNLTKVTLYGYLKPLGDFAFSGIPNLDLWLYCYHPEKMGENVFSGSVVTAHYIESMSTFYGWNESERQGYGGDVVWIPFFDHTHVPEKQVVPELEATWDYPGYKSYSVTVCALCQYRLNDKKQAMTEQEVYRENAALQKKYAIYLPVEGIQIIEEESYITLENGAVLSFDLSAMESRKFSLLAQMIPGGANPDVTWATSNSKVLTVSNGMVTFHNLGTATVTATSKADTRFRATVEIQVGFGDPAKAFTARLNQLTSHYGLNPASGLQLKDSVQMLVFGSNPDEPLAGLTYRVVSGGNYGSVDENGLITATAPGGTVKVEAFYQGDPSGRKASVSIKTTPILPVSMELIPQEAGSVADGYITADGFTDADSLTLWAKKGEKKVFHVSAVLADVLGNSVDPAKQITWKTSSKSLASVKTMADGSAEITIPANVSGSCTITATSKENPSLSLSFPVTVIDYAPKLPAAKATMNSWLTAAAVSLPLNPAQGNAIESVLLLNKNGTENPDLTASYQDGVLTIDISEDRSLNPEKNYLDSKTYALRLYVRTAHMEQAPDERGYPFELTLKVANSAPKITVKQLKKLNYKGLDPSAELSVTASGYDGLQFAWHSNGDSYYLREGTNRIFLSYPVSSVKDTKGTMTFKADNYRYIPDKAFTVATEAVTPGFKLNSYFSESYLLTKGNTLSYIPEEGISVQGDILVYEYNKKTKTYDTLSSELKAVYDAETQTLRLLPLSSEDYLKNGTRKVELEVSLDDATTRRYEISVSVSNSAPNITVRQLKKLNIKGLEPTAEISVSATGYAELNYKWTSAKGSFYLKEGTSRLFLNPGSSSPSKDVQGVMEFSDENFRYIPQQTFKVSIESVTPGVKMNSYLSEDYLLKNGSALSYTPEEGQSVQGDILVYEYNKKTKAYDTLSSSLKAVYDSEAQLLRLLPLSSEDYLKNGTTKVEIEVSLDDAVRRYEISVSVSNSAPKITVRQLKKLNYKGLDPSAELSVTASGYDGLQYAWHSNGDSYYLKEGTNRIFLAYPVSNVRDTKGTMTFKADNYRYIPDKAFTLATEAVNPVFKLNSYFSESYLLKNGNTLSYVPEAGMSLQEDVLVYEYNKKTKAYDIPSSELKAVYDTETQTLRLLPLSDTDVLKNGSRKVEIAVNLGENGIGRYELTVTVSNAAPKITISTQKKLNLYDPQSFANIQIVAKGGVPVTGVSLADTDFRCTLDADGRCTLERADGKQADTRGTLFISLEGYRYSVPQSYTVPTVKTAIAAASYVGTLTLYRSLPEISVGTSIGTNFQGVGIASCTIKTSISGITTWYDSRFGFQAAFTNPQSPVKAGTYTFTLATTATNGSILKDIKVKVKVVEVPSVKLSTATVSPSLSGSAATIPFTPDAPGFAGFREESLLNGSVSLSCTTDESGSVLSIALNPQLPLKAGSRYTVKLTPVYTNGVSEVSGTPVSLTIRPTA